MSKMRDARTALGLSQAEFAAKLGVHQTTVSRFERDQLPLDERTSLAVDALMLSRPKPARRASV